MSESHAGESSSGSSHSKSKDSASLLRKLEKILEEDEKRITAIQNSKRISRLSIDEQITAARNDADLVGQLILFDKKFKSAEVSEKKNPLVILSSNIRQVVGFVEKYSLSKNYLAECIKLSNKSFDKSYAGIIQYFRNEMLKKIISKINEDTEKAIDTLKKYSAKDSFSDKDIHTIGKTAAFLMVTRRTLQTSEWKSLKGNLCAEMRLKALETLQITDISA